MSVDIGRMTALARANNRIAWIAAAGAIGAILALPETAAAQLAPGQPPGAMPRGPAAAPPSTPRNRFDFTDLLDRENEKATTDNRRPGDGILPTPIVETDAITCLAGCDGDRGKVVYRAAAPKTVDVAGLAKPSPQRHVTSALVPASLTSVALTTSPSAAVASLAPSTSAFECIAGCEQPTLPRRAIGTSLVRSPPVRSTPVRSTPVLASAIPVRTKPHKVLAAKRGQDARPPVEVAANAVVIDAPAKIADASVPVAATVAPPVVDPSPRVEPPVATLVSATSLSAESGAPTSAIPVTKVAAALPAATRLKQSLAPDEILRSKRKVARKITPRTAVAKLAAPAPEAATPRTPPVIVAAPAAPKPLSPLANTPAPPKLAADTPESKAARRPVPKAVTVSTDWFNKANRERQEQAKATVPPTN